jgi:hypothetical protein
VFHKNGVSVFHSQKMEHYGFLKKITAGGFSLFHGESKNWDTAFVTIRCPVGVTHLP